MMGHSTGKKVRPFLLKSRRGLVISHDSHVYIQTTDETKRHSRTTTAALVSPSQQHLSLSSGLADQEFP